MAEENNTQMKRPKNQTVKEFLQTPEGKKWIEEMAKDWQPDPCSNGTCGHGHSGDPPGSIGGSDF